MFGFRRLNAAAALPRRICDGGGLWQEAVTTFMGASFPQTSGQVGLQGLRLKAVGKPDNAGPAHVLPRAWGRDRPLRSGSQPSLSGPQPQQGGRHAGGAWPSWSAMSGVDLHGRGRGLIAIGCG